MGAAILWIGKTCCYIGQLRQIQPLPLHKQNKTYPNKNVLQQHKGFKGNQNAIFYPYNHEVDDQGWGCAWRNIQTFLSSYSQNKTKDGQKIKLNFQPLFKRFGQKQELMNIARQIYTNDKNQVVVKKSSQNGKDKENISVLQILKKEKFAPIEVPYNWAEPLIGHLICHKYQIPSQLYLLNGYPQYSNAPQVVFSKRLNFKQFMKLVQDTIQKSTIFLDDSIAALNIMAFKKISQNQYHLIIGDPHVKDNREKEDAAIFLIKLDGSGKRIPYTDSQEDKKLKRIEKQNQKYMKYDNITGLDFSLKSWMILASDPKANNIKNMEREQNILNEYEYNDTTRKLKQDNTAQNRKAKNQAVRTKVTDAGQSPKKYKISFSYSNRQIPQK